MPPKQVQWVLTPESREHFISLLEQRGYDGDKLSDLRRLIDAPNSDLFDVLAYIRFAKLPKTRTDRTENVRHGGMDGVTGEMREFLLSVLKSYEAIGESELAATKLSGYLAARYGTTADARKALGDIRAIRQAFFDVQSQLYQN